MFQGIRTFRESINLIFTSTYVWSTCLLPLYPHSSYLPVFLLPTFFLLSAFFLSICFLPVYPVFFLFICVTPVHLSPPVYLSSSSQPVLFLHICLFLLTCLLPLYPHSSYLSVFLLSTYLPPVALSSSSLYVFFLSTCLLHVNPVFFLFICVTPVHMSPPVYLSSSSQPVLFLHICLFLLTCLLPLYLHSSNLPVFLLSTNLPLVFLSSSSISAFFLSILSSSSLSAFHLSTYPLPSTCLLRPGSAGVSEFAVYLYTVYLHVSRRVGILYNHVHAFFRLKLSVFPNYAFTLNLSASFCLCFSTGQCTCILFKCLVPTCIISSLN